MPNGVICWLKNRDRIPSIRNIASGFIRHSTYLRQISPFPLSDTNSIIRNAAFRCVCTLSESLLCIEVFTLRINSTTLRIDFTTLRINGTGLRIKNTQNDIFESQKCRSSRMISPQISTIISTDKYQEHRFP